MKHLTIEEKIRLHYEEYKKANWEEQTKLYDKNSQIDHISRLLDLAKIPKCWFKKEFEDFDFSFNPQNKEAYDFVSKYIKEKFYKKKGLFFIGGVGTGKTHLAQAILKYCVWRKQRCLMINQTRLSDEIRRRIKSYDNDNDYDLCLRVPVLLLDDFGVGNITEFIAEAIYRLVDERISILTFFTTNCTSEELNNKLGTRTLDRIKAMCYGVELKGKSYREL